MSTRRSFFVSGVLLFAVMLLGSVAPAEAQVTAAPGNPMLGSVVPNGYGALLVVWARDTSQTTADTPSGFDVRYEAVPMAASSNTEFTGVADTILKGGNATTMTISGLKHGTRYLVAVRARNAIGNSDWSPTAPAGTPASTLVVPVPDEVDDLTLTAMDMAIEAMWKAGDGNGVDITGYDVEVKPTAAAASQWQNHAHFGTSTMTTISGLMNGTEYSVRVRTLNGHKWGPDEGWSDVMKATPMADAGTTDPGTTDPGTTDPGTTGDDGVAEGAPEKVVLRTAAATSTTITISWEPPGSGMTRLVDYQLEYEAAGQGEFTNNITPEQVSVQSWSIPNLKPATSYMIRLRAQNRVQGYGPWSEYQTVTTPAAATTPPGEETVVGAPEKVRLRTSSAKSTTTTISIYWDVPGSGKSRLVDYQVRYGLAAGGDSGLLTNNVDVTATSPVSHIIEGLTAGTAYSYRVRAQNLQGYGPWSDAHAISTMATPGAPPAGPGISKMAEPMVEAGDMMLMVSWAEPASHKSITHYLVDYKTASATKWMAKAMNVTAMEYTIDGLINGTAYLVRVRAVDSAGAMGEWSDSGSGTPMAMEEPEEPQPTPALPIFGALALGAGLVAAGRRRLRRRELRAGRVQQQITR